MNLLSVEIKLLIIDSQIICVKSIVRGKILQQRVALCQNLLIIDKVLQIAFVALRNNGIYKFSSGVATFNNQVSVCRRNDHQRHKTNVVAKFIVNFVVALNNFFLSLFEGHHDFLFLFKFFKNPVNHKKQLTVFNILNGNRVEVTFTKSQMKNGV